MHKDIRTGPPARLGVAAVVWVLLGGTGCGFPGAAVVHPDPDQNVLLITIDTLRADAVGAYGGRTPTPAIDRLAAEGVRFEFAHAHAVTTLPSHASLLTGLIPPAHGVHANAGFRLPASLETLATRLRSRGFVTAAFIGGFPLDSRFGLARGFDRYDDSLGSPAAPGFLTERPAEAVVIAAQEWIEAQSGRWLVWIHLFDPHAPYQPPPSWTGGPEGDGYLREVAYADAALAPLLEKLRGAATRRTLVILTSDHGEALGDHGELTHGVFAYEPTLRVPLIMAQLGGPPPDARWRWRRPARVRRDPARHIDVVPTILEALELPVPPALPGRSLLRTERPDAPIVTYFEALEPNLARGWAPLRGLLVGRDKFIDVPEWELYDLEADPAEARNLAGERPERREVFGRLLAGFSRDSVSAAAALDADARARLRALGYASGRAPAKPAYSLEDDPKRLIAIERMVAAATDRLQTGDLAGAIAGYREALARRPGMADVAAQLAFAYWQAGQAAEALAALAPVVAGGAAGGGLLAQYGSYLAETGRAAEAIALLEPAARGDAPDLDVLNALGGAYIKGRRYEEAIAVLERLLALDPDDAVAYENLGAAYLERGDLTRARRALERALEAKPQSAGALVGLGALAWRAGDAAAAADYWRRALAVDPNDAEALYNLGLLLVREGHPHEARPYLERFVRVAPAAPYGPDLERVRALLRDLRD